MKRIVATFLSLMTFVAFADAQLENKSVEAKQRDMQSGIVDMTVTLQGDAETVAKCVCRFAATNSETKAAILIEHITRDGDDAGTGNVWTRKFIWDAAVDVGMEKIDDVELTVSVELLHGGVQLWEGGPYWAECNVGATRPEEYGYYFWWGDTVGYWRNADNNGWISVKDSTGFSFSYENCPTCGKDISQLQSAGYIDATGNLVAAHDAATAHLGAPWRMPTDAEFSALLNNCDAECTSYNGVSGRLVKGRGAYASKSIFLPAGGYGDDSDINFFGEYGSCWSSTLYSGGSGNAFDVDFDVEGGGFFGWNYSCRYSGRSVRPVRGIVNGVVTTHFGVDFAIKVTAVTAQQRCLRDGLVDITVTIQGKIEDVSKCSFVATNSATGAAIPVEHITQNGEDLGSGTIWTRKFIWDAKADVGTVKIDDVMLSVGAMIIDGVQLWENGPYWAECNVGATKPEEYGYYFWWGDTVGYKRNADNNGWVSVRDSTGFSFNSENCPTCGKDNSQLRLAGYIDSTGNLVAAYDAATAHLGVPWRMPTDSEISALISNCDTEWVSRNGVFGRLVKGRDAYATKSIFIPVAGYASGASIYQLGSYGHYFSSTPKSGNPSNALGLFVYSDGFSRGGVLRDDGQSVRPVREFAGSVIIGDAVTIHLALDCRTEVTWYVNGGTGSDRNSGESSASAKKTIQAAVDAARDGDTILVAAGTYAPFASKNKSVVIQSASGAAATLIDGTDALRPRVEMLDDTDSTFISVNNKTNTVLVGFTVEHCELIIGGTIQRCVIRDIDARAGGAPINFSIVENSLILNNLGCNGGAGDNCIFRNCTIVGNRATSGYRCVALNCVLENCIVCGNADNSSGTWPEWLRPMISDVGYREATVFRDNPLFVNAEGADYRLSKNSPCIDAGDNAYVTSETDLNGLDRVVNGRVDIGCCEYQHPIVEDGLVAWYKFNGNARDSSGNANDGVVYGAQLTADRAGNADGAYLFEGTDWIQIDSSVSLNSVQDTDEMSFAAWLRIDSYDTWVPIFCKATGADGDPLYDFKYTFGRYFEGYDADLIYLNSVPAVGVWTHVAVTINHGEIVIYQDGNEVGRGAGGAFNSTIPNDALCLGMDSVTYKEFLKGAMDDVRFYNRALTEQEVLTLHAGKIVEINSPTVVGDPAAIVTGDAETGFVIKPSEGKTAVEVTISQGVDAAKVTVEVSPKVASVKPNGAKVKIVSGGADITEFLNVPATDGNGVVDLTKATVKEEIVKEVLDVEKGAVIDLCSGSQGTASPTITTAPTRVGLFYQLREGETLGGMRDGDSTVGDGRPWSPEIKVKGGNSAFYSIGVGKGE